MANLGMSPTEHATVIHTITGMLDVCLQCNPSNAGAIEILQVLLHFKRFYYDFDLQYVPEICVF